VLLETTVDLAIEGDLLVRVLGSTEEDTRKMPVYLSIFALAQCVTAVIEL